MRLDNEMLRTARSLARDEQEGTRLGGKVFLSLLFVMFVFVLLVALWMNVSSFKSVEASRQADNYDRGTLSLIVSTVRANDREDGVAVGTGPEGASLVLVEHGDERDYETRIYLYQGNIVEEYAVASDPYTPKKASVMTVSSTFSFSYKDRLLSVTTDQGTAKVMLHCAGEGE